MGAIYNMYGLLDKDDKNGQIEHRPFGAVYTEPHSTIIAHMVYIRIIRSDEFLWGRRETWKQQQQAARQ